MENGRGLDLGLLPELAESLRCTTTYLLGLTADPQSWAPDGWLTPVPDDHRSPMELIAPEVPRVGPFR